MPDRLAVVIPAYRPSSGLVDLVRSLSEHDPLAIVIVDDGSGPDFRDVFSGVAEFPNVHLLRHAVNLGKGAALKTAINHVLCAFPALTGIVTADADGQHHPEDIRHVADTLMEQPQALILGSRNFDRDVPLRSRFGNIATRGIMHALLGQKLTDTQTGLRGIPASFLPKLMRHESTGYEFELEMLIASHQLAIPIVEVPIRTIYEAGNKSSHFNPIIDSMKIYFVLLRFGSVSVMSGILDSLVWALVWSRTHSVLTSTILARVVSVAFNYTLVRSSVFYSRQHHKTVLPKYLALVVASGTASYAGVQFLHERLGVSPIPAKLLVETLLFFVNFAVQRLFIFKPRESANGEQPAASPLVFSTLVAATFAALLGVEVYGFVKVDLFSQVIWSPIGLERFLRFLGAYLALAVPILAIVPWTFAVLVTVILVPLTAVSVGPQAPLAVAFLMISSCALGSKFIGRGKVQSLTADVCATLLGLGIYVMLMLLVVRLPVNYPAGWAVLLAIPIVLDIRGVWRRLTYWTSRLRRISLCSWWERASFALLLFLLAAHWLVALKPETSADGLAMHLAAPMNIAANHALTYRPDRVLWSLMPMGGDWSYTIVYLLGGEYAARILNYSMLLIAVALVYAGVRRWVSPALGFLLAASFAASPLVQLVTGSLFVENFLAAMILGMLTAVWLFGDTGDRRFLFLAAFLAGTAAASKYGSLVFVAAALPFAVAEAARHWKSLGPRPWAVCAATLLLMVAVAAPTYAIAYYKTGNPIYPFFNRTIHSPLLNPTVEFLDARFHEPFGWSTLYGLTFHTSDYFEGQNGSFGFQYMVLAPLALVAMLAAARRSAMSAAFLALGGGAAIMLSTPNARYLYTCMALLLLPVAALLAWLKSNERWMFRVLVVYLVAATSLNAFFLPSSGFYNKDFCLRLPLSRVEKTRYLKDAAPIRDVIAWYDQHHPDSTVLLTEDSSIAGLTGDFYMNHWHQYPTAEALERAHSLPNVLRLLESWHVAYFIARKPSPGDDTRPPSLQTLLMRCTQPEYESGEFYVARLEQTCESAADTAPKDAGPLLTVSRGAYDDFDPAIRFRGDWARDTSFEGPDRHTISYSEVPGAEFAMAFEGSDLIYVFTRAPNRGIAAIDIDGKDQSPIDLYSPAVQWQFRQRICCTTPGRHVLTIRVTDRTNPKSSGHYVDLDSLEVW